MSDLNKYWKLLNNPKWKLKRALILRRDSYRCTYCGSNEKLHIHHKQYHFSKKLQVFKKPWEYNDNLLTTLCSICHQNGHDNYSIPTKYF
jgi:5-methylcytosine-specific restriction endonuclease McrA